MPLYLVHSRDTIQTLSDKDHVYCLMLEEMSVRQHMQFNEKFGCFESFVDAGSHGRTSRFANHALVFMLCGLPKTSTT